jgi:hypothetical protein
MVAVKDNYFNHAGSGISKAGQGFAGLAAFSWRLRETDHSAIMYASILTRLNVHITGQ